MRRIIIVWTLLFGCILSVLCQNDWSIVYDHDLTYEDYTAIEILNDTIYTAHFQWNRDTSLFGVVFMKYDSNGFLLDTLECFNPDRILTTYNHYSGFKIYNRTLYFYGTGEGYVTYLIKATTDFTQDTIIYYPPNAGVNFTGATGLLATESGLYLLAQQKKPGEMNDILVIHTDLDGKEIWRTVYGEPGAEELALSIIQNQKGQIIIGGSKTSSYQGSLNNWSKEWIILIDTLGNIRKEWSSVDVPNRGCIRGLHLLNEFYIYPSSTNQYPSNFDYKTVPNFCKRDTATFSLAWQTDIPSPNNNYYSSIWNATLNPDNTAIIGVGRKDDGGPAFHYKVSTETGEVIYKRNLVGCTQEYDAIDTDLFDVACLSSGSTVACGYTVLDTPVAPAYTGWVVKTNAWGQDLLDDCSTVSSAEPQYAQNELFIYPNPCTDYFTIEPPSGYTGAYQIRLYAGTGALVRAQSYAQSEVPRMVVHDLPSGLYYVQVVSAQGQLLGVGKVVK